MGDKEGRRARFGSLAFILFGIVLLGMGGRSVVHDRLLALDGKDVLAQVVDTGSVRRQSGGFVNYIEYRFTDPTGVTRTGRSSGYSGTRGETVLVRYSQRFPFIHRVSGEGDKLGYEWRWWIAAAGALFTVVGFHSLVYLRNRRRLRERLGRRGMRVSGEVVRLAHDGRTIYYRYTSQGGTHRGRSLPLSPEQVREYAAGSAIEVLVDPAHPKRSVLALEV